MDQFTVGVLCGTAAFCYGGTFVVELVAVVTRTNQCAAPTVYSAEFSPAYVQGTAHEWWLGCGQKVYEMYHLVLAFFTVLVVVKVG